MLGTIVLALDGSEFAESALPLALSLAAREGARLEVVTVVSPAVNPNLLEHLTEVERGRHEQATRGAQAYHEALRRRLAEESPDVDVGFTVLAGAVAPALERYVRERGGDLLVLTTHGRGPLRRAWLGSVADGLVRRTPAPVLLLRPSDAEESRRTVHDGRFAHVLVPLDGSEAALEAVPLATEIGGPDARYTLLQVVPPLAPAWNPYLPHLAHDVHEEEEIREAAKRHLEEIAAPLEAEGRAVETRVVSGAQPAAGILEFAQENDVDLIAMSTQGRGGVARLVVGSVADKVVRAGDTPVLLHRVSAEE